MEVCLRYFQIMRKVGERCPQNGKHTLHTIGNSYPHSLLLCAYVEKCE